MSTTVCEFCGQVLMDNQECDCADAAILRAKKRAIENATDCIKDTVSEWPEEWREILFQGAEEIVMNDMKKITIEDNYGIKITLSSANKSYIKIDRTDTSKLSTTI